MEFITLSCPSCGGKLQITNDIERFACMNCGTEHIVKRSGGIVSLSPVIDVMQGVKSGVDRTAAELAIMRHEKHLIELQEKMDQLLKSNKRKPIPSFPIAIFVIGFVLALNNVFSGYSVLLWVWIAMVLIGGIPLVLYIYLNSLMKKNIAQKYPTIKKQIDSTKKEIENLKSLVSR